MRADLLAIASLEVPMRENDQWPTTRITSSMDGYSR